MSDSLRELNKMIGFDILDPATYPQSFKDEVAEKVKQNPRKDIPYGCAAIFSSRPLEIAFEAFSLDDLAFSKSKSDRTAPCYRIDKPTKFAIGNIQTIKKAIKNKTANQGFITKSSI